MFDLRVQSELIADDVGGVGGLSFAANGGVLQYDGNNMVIKSDTAMCLR